jgi:Copper binding proteins, plastocyanin/azurin family
MRRFLPLIAVLALLAPSAATPASSATKLTGTTGPSFTITLKKAGKKVTKLKAGKYTIAVSDRSIEHNFVLNGPGIKNKLITGLGFKGTKTVTVTLKKGRYEYYCTPHRFMGMRGFVTVS